MSDFQWSDEHLKEFPTLVAFINHTLYQITDLEAQVAFMQDEVEKVTDRNEALEDENKTLKGLLAQYQRDREFEI